MIQAQLDKNANWGAKYFKERLYSTQSRPPSPIFELAAFSDMTTKSTHGPPEAPEHEYYTRPYMAFPSASAIHVVHRAITSEQRSVRGSVTVFHPANFGQLTTSLLRFAR